MKWLETKRGRDLAGLGLIALLVLVLLWPVTFGGRLLLPADMLMVMQPWKAHAQQVGFDRVHTPFLDSIQQHYPWRKFAAEQMRQGTIPLWNPYMFCGAPFVANNQSACFYPETWLFLLMPPEKAFGWSALLSLIMGGTFMFLFLRVLGLRRSAAVVGTVPFLLCGFLVGWMLLPTVRAVPMWLPLMLLAFEMTIRYCGARTCAAPTGGMDAEDGAARGRALAWAALCALAIGLQFLAGHLHVSLFILLVFGAYVAFRVIQTAAHGQRKAALCGLVSAAVSLFTGALLAMLQLLPVLELVGMNPRKAGSTFAGVQGNAMVPAYLLAGLMPDAFGNPVDYNFWGWSLFSSHREYVETVWYSGIATLVLMVAAFAFRRLRRSQTWFWAGTWLGGLGLAWGTVVYWLLFQLVPPLRQLPGISRAVLICDFSAAVLAGFGFDALCTKLQERDPESVRRLVDRTALILGLVALAGGGGLWLYTGRLESAVPGIGNYTLTQLLRCLALIGVTVAAMAVMTWTVRRPEETASALPGGKRGTAKVIASAAARPCVPAARIAWGKALLLGVLAVDLLYFAGRFLPAVPDRYLHVQCDVLDRMHEDKSVYRMTSLIGDGKGIDRMPPNLTMAFGLQDVQGSDSLVFDGYQGLLSLVPKDAKGNPDPTSPVLDLLNCKYLLTSLDLTRTPGWKLVTDYETNLYENTQVLPRAFVPAQIERVQGEEALQRMKGQWQPTALTFLQGDLPAQMAPGSGTIAISDYAANTVTLRTNLPAGRPAVLGDIWYPGWHAYVDGRETPVLRADYILRAVVPQQPAKEIRFVYYPACFAVGGFLTCLAVMFIACGLTMGRRRR